MVDSIIEYEERLMAESTKKIIDSKKDLIKVGD